MNLQHRMIAFQEASTHCQDIKISYNHYTLFLLSTTPSKKTNLLLLGALNFQQLFLPLILPLQVELLEPPPDLFMLQLTLLQTSRNQQNSLQKIKFLNLYDKYNTHMDSIFHCLLNNLFLIHIF